MIDKNTPACDMTIGGNIYKAGNAREFKQVTGEVLNLFTYLRNVLNVVYVFQFALMMLFL